MANLKCCRDSPSPLSGLFLIGFGSGGSRVRSPLPARRDRQPLRGSILATAIVLVLVLVLGFSCLPPAGRFPSVPKVHDRPREVFLGLRERAASSYVYTIVLPSPSVSPEPLSRGMAGRVTVNVVPSDFLDWTSMVPWCSWTTFFATARPRPVPLWPFEE